MRVTQASFTVFLVRGSDVNVEMNNEIIYSQLHPAQLSEIVIYYHSIATT